jgi:hypothetical protein
MIECSTHKEIAETFSTVRRSSFNEKKSPLMDQKKINQLLDRILELRQMLDEKTNWILSINERLERITWYNDLDEECYMLLNDLISSLKDLHSSYIRQYVELNLIRQKGIAKDNIKDFKNAVDELKVNYQDLESVFFFLPEMDDFVETTRQLSLIK